MSAQPDHVRFGRYRVVRELGRGAMGVVYEAEDESLQRPVAIKTMLLSDDESERAEYEARFRQEAKAAAGLNHANVITVYDMGREGDWLYIAMELLDGVELRSLIRDGSLTVPQCVAIIAQVASGLSAAHRRGIIHRDIKPANVMVLSGHRAKIMDFGVARVQASEVKTRTGVMLGSPKYMSPEQVEGRPIDHRSDIFSLGTVLYEAVTGSPPFGGNDLGSLLFAIARAEPPPPSTLNPGVPQGLDGIVARCLRKDPAERYQDAQDLANDLAQCAASFGSNSVPAPLDMGMPSVPAPLEMTVPPSSSLGIEAGGSEKTVVEARTARVPRPAPPPPAAPDSASMTASTGSALIAGIPVSSNFDSAAALRRLEQLATGSATVHARTPVGDRGKWAWPVAYAAAAVVALGIAFL